METNINKLSKTLGHDFKDSKLLERAITHRSWAFENLDGADDESVRDVENESVEFLGDSVLGLVIAEQLYTAHPKDKEGALTLMKHQLVSTATLASIATRIDLGSYMRVGRGEEKTGGRKKQALLADTLEAVIGAVFLDGGYDAARDFILGTFAEEIRNATPGNSIDYKTMLQELLQSRKLDAPTYNVVKTEGPPHDRVFYVEATWNGGTAKGEGNSIKAAEMMAAESGFNKLKPEEGDNSSN